MVLISREMHHMSSETQAEPNALREQFPDPSRVGENANHLFFLNNYLSLSIDMHLKNKPLDALQSTGIISVNFVQLCHCFGEEVLQSSTLLHSRSPASSGCSLQKRLWTQTSRK